MKIEVSKSLYQADVVRGVLYKYLNKNIHVEENEFCLVFNARTNR